MKKSSNIPATSLTPTDKATKIVNRFLSKLKDADNGCLLYTGSKLKTGYGVFHNPDKGPQLAHRFSYESYHGVTLKPDEYVRHSEICCSTACCNPQHLKVGSAQDNSDDMVNAGRSMKGRKNPQKRFTQSEKDEIAAYAASGKTQYWIAKKLGRAESVISFVLAKLKPKAPKPIIPLPKINRADHGDTGCRGDFGDRGDLHAA